MFRRCRLSLGVSIALALSTQTTMVQAQYGIVISGAGPVNRSMAGASTAAPIDASGALYWNPAAITGLCGSQLDVGLEALYADTRVSSSIAANTFGLGVPPIDLSGTSRSDSGVALLPTVALVYQSCESPWVCGLGLFSAGGFSVNYPGSTTNPILTQQPPAGLGFGPTSADLQIFQIVPTVACRLTDRLSVGIGPTLSLAKLTADPAFLATPDDVNGNYLAATHGRMRAGGGVQAGIFYSATPAWHFGASVKSPQWFETFKYNTSNVLGQPRTAELRFDFPLMASIGASYCGCPRWLFAVDFRYIDYENTAGFQTAGFDPSTGRVTGLGWDSVFAVAAGAQYTLAPGTTLRMGYSYNTNPVDDANTMFSVPAPLIIEHTFYCGASQAITDTFVLSFAYIHAFENSVTGPFVLPVGPIPGTSVQSRVSADAFVFGATVRF